MAFFGVTIEEIDEIIPHPNADRLEIAKLKGVAFQFVVARGSWQKGDRCLYFPLDAILPENILQALNLEGKLAGSKRNRVKTIKLRGEISQGIVGPLSLIDELSQSERTPENITEFLQVKKYEPEIDLPMSHNAELKELPNGVGVYDIEGTERFPDAYNELLDQEVWISEKLEGSHFAFAIIDGEEWVCQRRFSLIPVKTTEDKQEEHFFWKVAKEQGILELGRKLYKDTGSLHIVMRGEIIGPNIQKNIYRLEKREVRFFDLNLDRKYINPDLLMTHFSKMGAENMLVPTISHGGTLRSWLNGKTIQEASNGESLLHKTQREGIVVQPIKVIPFHEDLNGRLILKQRSPEYLAGEK